MPKATRVLLLAVAVLAVGLAIDSHGPARGLPKDIRPPKQDGKTESRDAQTAQHGTDSMLPVVRISPAQIEELVSRQKAEQHEQESSPDWWIISLTGLLAVATVGLWIATRDLVSGAEKTAKRQLRPYLIAKVGGMYLQEPGTGRRFTWAPEIWNTGQTPAYKVRSIVRVNMLPYPLPENVGLAPDPTDEYKGQTTLGKGETVSIHAPAPRIFTAAEVEAVRSRAGVALYAWGTAYYEDTFGDTHYTNFCFCAAWDGPTDVRGELTKQHNDAD
jgi:hypothetical protein